MMILLRCWSYRALGKSSIELSSLLNRELPENEDGLISLADINPHIETLLHRHERPSKLPELKTIQAYKNAAGASSWDSRINLPLDKYPGQAINVFVQSKLRVSGQRLTEAMVDAEYAILSRWKAANQVSQITMITCAEMAAHPRKHADLICIDRDVLDAYFGKILGARRSLMQLNHRRVSGWATVSKGYFKWKATLIVLKDLSLVQAFAKETDGYLHALLHPFINDWIRLRMNTVIFQSITLMATMLLGGLLERAWDKDRQIFQLSFLLN